MKSSDDGKWKKVVKRIVRFCLYSTYLFVAVIALLELSFRMYVFDFYGSNFRMLNQELLENRNSNKKTILAIGDSFTADPSSYIKILRDSLSNVSVFNGGVPGTTAKQQSLFIKRRVGQTNPDILIYQVYVGNDLFEFKHRTSSSSISIIRKIYWWLSDRLWVTGYINSKLPQLRNFLPNDSDTSYDPKNFESYNPETYSVRTRRMFQVETDYLYNSVMLDGKRKKDNDRYIIRIKKMLRTISNEIPVYILVVPHCAQLNDTYLNRMKQLGGTFKNDGKFQSISYPFLYALDSIQMENIRLINPISFLREVDEIQPVYFGNDPHLNPYGQKILGTYLIDSVGINRDQALRSTE